MRSVILTAQPNAGISRRWNEFLAASDFATHYVTPGYFIDPYVRGDRFAVLVEDGTGEIVAVATGVANGKRYSSGLFSRPQVAFRRGSNIDDAVGAIDEAFEKLGSTFSEVYSWQAMAAFENLGYSASRSSEATSVVMLDLSRGTEAIFASFSQTRRSEIRKAERQNIVSVSEVRDDAEIDELYAIHCDWNARKGNKPDTIAQMRTAISQLDNRRVFVAKIDGTIVAGSFYRFCPGGVVEYAANFSMPEFQRFRPNDLIGWHAIKWACDEAFSHFSMGGSHLFLRRFGGEIVGTYRYRRDNSVLKLQSLQETARDAAVGAYGCLPDGIRQGVRRVFAR